MEIADVDCIFVCLILVSWQCWLILKTILELFWRKIKYGVRNIRALCYTVLMLWNQFSSIRTGKLSRKCLTFRKMEILKKIQFNICLKNYENSARITCSLEEKCNVKITASFPTNGLVKLRPPPHYPTFTCSKLTIETLEQGVKCVQS